MENPKSVAELNNFYVYEHWRPDTNTCFYVGKGKDKRAWVMSSGRNNHHKGIQSKLTSLGLSVHVKIIIDNVSEETAFLIERDLIANHGMENLANKTSGGEGCSRPLSEEHKAKISRSKIGNQNAKGHSLSIEAINKIKMVHTGSKRSDETKAKMSKSQKGHTRNRGIKLSEQAKINMSLAAKKRWERQKSHG